jgi:hypothetical protein
MMRSGDLNRSSVTRLIRVLLAGGLAGVLVTGTVSEIPAQTMPGHVYFELGNSGHEKLAKKISKKLELRADPGSDDVNKLLEQWERETGGPVTGWDWVAVERLWIRAADPVAADSALQLARDAGGVPEAILLLDQARIAFLTDDPDLAEQAYWEGCEASNEAAALEYWLDIEPLATPDEAAEWDRFRRLPVPARDMCQFLRKFWAERSLASGLPVGSRMSLHYARLRFALDNYSRRGGKKGPTFTNRLGRPQNAMFDDRGLLYVRLGNPDRLTSFAGNPSIQSDLVSAECYQPNESWAYDYPEGIRLFHLSAFGGTDDYWLVENLAAVYRCGNPRAGADGNVSAARLTPVNEHRSVVMGMAAALVLPDLYRSRQGLDMRYAQAAQRMSDPTAEYTLNTSGAKALEAQKVLQEERDQTWADGGFVVSSVPDRPVVRTNARLLVEELQFRGSSLNLSRVWLNAVIEAVELQPVEEPGGGFRYRVGARWLLVDDLGELRRVQSGFEAVVPRVLGRDESLPIRLSVDLPPGQYRYNLIVRDAADPVADEPPAGNYHRSEILVRQFAVAIPDLSDVAVSADSGGQWSPIGSESSVVGIRPNPVHLTGPGGIAFVYFETYGLTPGSAYTTTVQLEPIDGGGDTFDLSFPGDAPLEPGPRVGRILRLDLSDSDPGTYRMLVSVEDETTGERTLPFETEVIVRGTRD